MVWHFCFFFCLKLGPQAVDFCGGFRPLSKRGNSQRLSARFNYLSSYGMGAHSPDTVMRGDRSYVGQQSRYGKLTVKVNTH